MQYPQGIAAERTTVFPPLAEAELEVPNSRTLDRDLGVMPWGPVPVDRRHGLPLAVAVMVGVVAAAVAQVDTARKSNIALAII
jgi:hypothetical protein